MSGGSVYGGSVYGGEGGESTLPPAPGKRTLTPLGLEMLESLPPVLRDSADYQAIIHAEAKEIERLEASLELVRAQFNPGTASVLLGVWERITRQTVAPVGKSEAERQAAITARLRKLLSIGYGSAWEEQITALIGPGWDYKEHIPGDGTSPPVGTLRIILPFPPEGSRYLEALAQIREVTHAHLEIEFESAGGFLLDESRLDLEELTV